MNSIDLGSPPAGHTFEVSIEKEETDGERRVRLAKDVALFVVALLFFIVIAAGCLYVAFIKATGTADEKKWAQTVLGAAAGGLLGYLIKK